MAPQPPKHGLVPVLVLARVPVLVRKLARVHLLGLGLALKAVQLLAMVLVCPYLYWYVYSYLYCYV